MNYNKTYARLLAAQGSCCFYCSTPLLLSDATRDHVIPRAAKKNGMRVRRQGHNIVLACSPCNRAKGPRLPTAAEIARAHRVWLAATTRVDTITA